MAVCGIPIIISLVLRGKRIGGALQNAFLNDNAPERKSSCSAIGLHFARPPRNMFFGTFYLAIAIHAADELGGADELLCGRQQLIFKGDGFRIVIMNLRDPGTDVRTIDVPDVEGGAV